MEVMKAVSFMYVRPPGYNAESAKAAEMEDEKKRSDPDPGDMAQGAAAASTSSMPDKAPEKTQSGSDKKNRPKDVFGRPLPTEQEFEVLKNAPRLETGAPVRIKPFAVEVRNVRCLRCGNYGHQSGDRECPLKDVIMPNEESRLKRDDPLTTIKAQTDSSELLKWELKQKPGMSPPRGGFDPDDPNQQIVAEDIFDEYGGFLGNLDIPALISNFSASKSKKRSKKKSKHRQVESDIHEESSRHESSYHLSSDSEEEKRNKTSRIKRKKKYCSDPSHSDSEVDARKGKHKSKHRHKKKNRSESSSDSEDEVCEDTRRHLKREHRREKREESPSSFPEGKGNTESKRHSRRSREKHHYDNSSSSSESERHSLRYKDKQYYSDSSPDRGYRHSRRTRGKRCESESSSSDASRRPRRSTEKQRHTDLSPHHTDRHSKISSSKRDYTESSRYESSRQSRRSREKRRYSDSSASDYSDSDQTKKMLSSSTSTLRLHQPAHPHRRQPAAAAAGSFATRLIPSRRWAPPLRSRAQRIRALDAAQPFDYESRAAGLLEERQRLKIAIVGFGNFGQFLARTFARQGHTLLAHSRTDHSALAATLGASFFTDPHDLCECHPDVVLLATSILSAEAVLRSLPVHRLRRNTLFVDVLSVKEFPKNLLLSSLPPDFDVICTHPMFGPESARDGWDGLPFVFDKVRVGDCPARRARAEAFLNIFEREGCRMVEMSCAEHDAHAAETQFLTHTVGRMLAMLELRSTPINTKGYETLLRLVDNTCSDSFDLYNGLFMYNKNSTELLNRLEWAMDSVKKKLFDGLHDVLRKQLFEGSAQVPSTSNIRK
ncbi:hypothetical protein HU200_006104 [Digitaria exilis]|uniref:Prephenate/arogenate dehydrogenase domain-containing protein n=1 Tax=Digitaria exilis TaxID=1010633 RepID=A0A835FQM2_9POAL|nr:hypothetical protein HU200_006104 [Digitaria exilis]